MATVQDESTEAALQFEDPRASAAVAPPPPRSHQVPVKLSVKVRSTLDESFEAPSRVAGLEVAEVIATWEFNAFNEVVATLVADCRTSTATVDESGFGDFLEATYRLSASGHDREAVDWIIEKLDDQLNADQFTECNAILRAVNPEKLSDPLIVTFLGITLGAKGPKLPSRDAFYYRALHEVARRRGEAGAEKLLSKYR